MSQIREEQGEVIEITGNLARVRVRRGSKCGSCASEHMCGMVSKDETVMTAVNPVGASKGQTVCLSFKVESQVRASFVLYLIPVMALVAGALIGYRFQFLGDKEISGAAFSLLFVALAFLGIKYYTHIKYAKDQSYIPTITKVVA